MELLDSISLRLTSSFKTFTSSWMTSEGYEVIRVTPAWKQFCLCNVSILSFRIIKCTLCRLSLASQKTSATEPVEASKVILQVFNSGSSWRCSTATKETKNTGSDCFINYKQVWQKAYFLITFHSLILDSVLIHFSHSQSLFFSVSVPPISTSTTLIRAYYRLNRLNCTAGFSSWGSLLKPTKFTLGLLPSILQTLLTQNIFNQSIIFLLRLQFLFSEERCLDSRYIVSL